MAGEHDAKVKSLVDNLKSICNDAGLSGDGDAYKIVTQSFLYKFLNDKFLYEIQRIRPDLKNHNDILKLSDNEYNLLMMKVGANSAKLKADHLLTYLFEHQNDGDIAKQFDETLNDIATQNKSIFSVHTSGNESLTLFEEKLIQGIIVSDKEEQNSVAKDIINALVNCRFNFDEMFSDGFDFFSTIFEYMIKDYNKDGGGDYAEYYTPHSISKVMADILVGDANVQNVKVYDPAAGSGTLLMNLANRIGTDRCTIYSQDRSKKSTNLLRLNLILNNLTHSIANIVKGNTITENKHTQKMDFIVSNPPFKVDFSGWRDSIEELPNSKERFFAGIPTIPDKAKKKMPIYLLFIQHILYSLSDTGKAAIVVPTIFLTGGGSIGKKIRKKICEEHNWLEGVITMPSNIFATTGTNVSVIFIDKTKTDDEVILIDASNLGIKEKVDGTNQKTYLSKEEEILMANTFKNKEEIEDFSIKVTKEEMIKKNYSRSAGQYFDIKIEYIDITAEEFENKMKNHEETLKQYFSEGKTLEDEIFNQLKNIKYE